MSLLSFIESGYTYIILYIEEMSDRHGKSCIVSWKPKPEGDTYVWHG